jgi:hypothetical protein
MKTEGGISLIEIIGADSEVGTEMQLLHSALVKE